MPTPTSLSTFLLASAPPADLVGPAPAAGAAEPLPLLAEIGIALVLALVWLGIVALAAKFKRSLGRATIVVIAFAVLLPFLAAFLISWTTAVWFVGFFVFILAGLALVITRTGRPTDPAAHHSPRAPRDPHPGRTEAGRGHDQEGAGADSRSPVSTTAAASTAPSGSAAGPPSTPRATERTQP